MIDDLRLIGAARTMLAWSQDDLRDRSGVSKVTLSQIECGRENVRVATVIALQSALESGGIRFVPATGAHGPGIYFRAARGTDHARERNPLVLRAFRHMLGWSEVAAARPTGISRGSIVLMERGIAGYRLQRLVELREGYTQDLNGREWGKK